MDKVSLNILGSCVVRDTFGMHEEDGGYLIERYVRVPNPVSLVMNSPLRNENIEITNDIFSDTSAFIARCQALELKKQVFEYLEEKISDYLVVDCAEFRRELLYFEETDGWFTKSFKNLLDKYIQKGWIPEHYESINLLEREKDTYCFLKSFCDRLLSAFDRERIILFEIKAVEFYTDGKEVRTFTGEHKVVENHNDKMKFCYDYVKSYLCGCYVVEFPGGVLGDLNHKWGKNPLHYISEYYSYAKKCVDIITSSMEHRDKEKALKFLKCNVEKELAKKYGNIEYRELEKNLG